MANPILTREFAESTTEEPVPHVSDTANVMTQITGMSLYGRWEGWEHQPFTDDSTSHVSVWKRNVD